MWVPCADVVDGWTVLVLTCLANISANHLVPKQTQAQLFIVVSYDFKLKGMLSVQIESRNDCDL